MKYGDCALSLNQSILSYDAIRFTFKADFSLMSCKPAASFSQYTVAFTSMWSAKKGSSSLTFPVIIFTTPPGKSELFSTSANVTAHKGLVLDAKMIQELPPAMMGAINETKPISTYVFAFAVGDFTEFDDEYAKLENGLIEHECDYLFIGYSCDKPITNKNEANAWK